MRVWPFRKTPGAPEKLTVISEVEQMALRRHRRYRNRLIALIILAVLLALVILLAIQGRKWFFSNNSRFTLRQVEVKSTDYYHRRADILCQLCNLRREKDNIFNLNLAQIQQRISALPKVKSCRVQRKLPDTISIEIIERIPRARIKFANLPERWVVDDNCVLLPINLCTAYSLQELPVIGRIPVAGTPLGEGKIYESVRPAVNLIMRVVCDFGDIEIGEISMEYSGKLLFSARYHNNRLRPMEQVLMPDDDAGMPLRLRALRTELIVNPDAQGLINLSYEGKLIRQTQNRNR